MQSLFTTLSLSFYYVHACFLAGVCETFSHNLGLPNLKKFSTPINDSSFPELKLRVTLSLSKYYTKLTQQDHSQSPRLKIPHPIFSLFLSDSM
jgi:hypothetical protein